ncbi:hypothetical protein AAKU67_004236 [Oxalobacteraceae bacterium GrIS 2.11]
MKNQKLSFTDRCTTYLLGIFLGIGAMVNPSFADEWQWIRVSPDYTPNHVGWQILQGKAEVKIKDGRISTELKYDDEKYYYRFLIDGTVNKNGDVSVTEIQEHTDAGAREFAGTLEIAANPKADWEYDRILLKGGPNFVSLFRIIKK